MSQKPPKARDASRGQGEARSGGGNREASRGGGDRGSGGDRRERDPSRGSATPQPGGQPRAPGGRSGTTPQPGRGTTPQPGRSERDREKERPKEDRPKGEGSKPKEERPKEDRPREERRDKDREDRRDKDKDRDREHRDKDREQRDKDRPREERKDKDREDRRDKDRPREERPREERKDKDREDRRDKDRDRDKERDKDREQRDKDRPKETEAEREKRKEKERAERREKDKDREHRDKDRPKETEAEREKRKEKERAERREKDKDGHREHRDKDRPPKESKDKGADNPEAWLDDVIDDTTDKRGGPSAKHSERDNIPKRPSSRADSRPRAGGEAAAAAAAAKSAADAPAPEGKVLAQATPSASAPRPKNRQGPAPDAIDDEDIEGENNVGADGATKKPAEASPNVTQIDEDIGEEEEPVVNKEQEVSKDEIEEEVDYDDDFEDVEEDEEEEYKPQVKSTGPSPSPRPDSAKQSNVITFRPPTGQVRSPSPGVQGGDAMSEIKRAMEQEKLKAQQKVSKSSVPDSDGGNAKKGMLADYESTMPKFNLQGGRSVAEQAALQRLRDLKKMKMFDRRSVEKFDVFQQRPQNTHSMFLAGKSRRFCNLKSVSCQTGDDDLEAGTMTEDIWKEDKEMQFPTLTMGVSMKNQNEPSQMLPFLRRAMPLFEAALAEAKGRQGGTADNDPAEGGAPAEAPTRKAVCRLADSFVRRCIGSEVRIADVDVCPEWYGADHAVVLYSWQWSQRPVAPEASSTLDAFMRPLQSMVGLYPLVSSGAADSGLLRPTRCLYSFSRLCSAVVMTGRPHLIIAGSEMGSLLVWDLRAKPHGPIGHSIRFEAGAAQENGGADEEIKHFEGALWLDSVFSTDSLSLSTLQRGSEKDEADPNEEGPGGGGKLAAEVGGSVHTAEVCCVRCSDGAGGDTLIFALDVTGVVTFWRVLELGSTQGSSVVKLALQGTLSIGDETRPLCGFLGASLLCIHPQQQLQCVVVSASGLRQAHRQKSSMIADGPRTLKLSGPFGDEDAVCSAGEACGGAFNPFFSGLLLAAYTDGDLALFDCSLCVPVLHWGSAISTAPTSMASVAWSPCRPCVFFVKSGNCLDVWDLADRTYGPVITVDIASQLGVAATSADLERTACSELHVNLAGQPVVGYNGTALVLTLPAKLTTPLQGSTPHAHPKWEDISLRATAREKA